MTVSIKHAFHNPILDAGDPDIVGPNEWNAAHVVEGGTSAGVLYKNAVGALDTSTIALVSTEDDYEFFFLGDNYADAISRWTGPHKPLLFMDRLVDWEEINDNTCVDFTTLTAQGDGGIGNQYASFNSKITTTDTAYDWNHLVAFEDQKVYEGSGTLTEDWTVVSFPTYNGPVTNRRAFYVQDGAGSGTLTNQYGFYCASLAKGTNNWAFYAAGATPNYFGGALLLSGTSTSIPTGATFVVNKSTTAPNQASINGSVVSVSAHLIGATDAANYMAMDAYGTAGNSIVGRRARGTQAAPTAIQSGDSLFQVTTLGYAGSGAYAASKWSAFGAILLASATENWSPTNQGSAWDFYATATGTTSLAVRVRIGDGLMVGTTTSPGIGAILATASIKSMGSTQGIGYATGAGGAVTQLTSRTTGVTINKVCGAITLFAAAPAVGAWVSFTVTNSAVAATDVPRVAVKSGTNTYIAQVTAVAAGSFQISFASILGTASDSPVLNFDIGKAVAA